MGRNTYIAIGAAAVVLLGGILLLPVTLSYIAYVWIGDWTEAQGQLVEIRFALEDYRSDHGKYPTEEEGLMALLALPPEGREGPRFYFDRYVTSPDVFVDPWGREVIYRAVTDGGCEILSLGRDGRSGGYMGNRDIILMCNSDSW